jgi:hypothetical protein
VRETIVEFTTSVFFVFQSSQQHGHAERLDQCVADRSHFYAVAADWIPIGADIFTSSKTDCCKCLLWCRELRRRGYCEVQQVNFKFLSISKSQLMAVPARKLAVDLRDFSLGRRDLRIF